MSKNKVPNVSNSCSTLLKALSRTRNLKVLSFFVKQAINTRDRLRGKDVAELEFDLSKVPDSKSRKRAGKMLDQIAALTETKDVSVFCAAAIAQRKLERARQAVAAEAAKGAE